MIGIFIIDPLQKVCTNDTINIMVSYAKNLSESKSITDSPFVVALIGLLGGLTASIITYYYERKKLYADNTSLALTTLNSNLGQIHKIKIDGLKEFNKIKFQSLQLIPGPEESSEDYYRRLWENSEDIRKNVETFLLDFSYGYPIEIKDEIKGLYNDLLKISLNYSESISQSLTYLPNNNITEIIKTLDGRFSKIIKLVEEDLMINSDFINKYIKQNQ